MAETPYSATVSAPPPAFWSRLVGFFNGINGVVVALAGILGLILLIRKVRSPGASTDDGTCTRTCPGSARWGHCVHCDARGGRSPEMAVAATLVFAAWLTSGQPNKARRSRSPA